MLACPSQDPYKIDELAASVHPLDGHGKLFVMLDAYLDESGIHDGAAVCVVAGYIAEHKAWRSFEKSWRATLKHFGIGLADFHAKIILKRSDPVSKKAVESLALLIRKHRLRIHPVSAAIVVSDFNSLSLDQRRFMTGASFKGNKLVGDSSPNKPYYIPFQHCIRQAVSYGPPDARVHFYVGLDRTLYDYATVLYRQIVLHPKADQRLGNLGAPKAAETPQLQAADLLAHILYVNYPEFLKAYRRQVQLTSLPRGPQLVSKDLLIGTRLEKDHTFQDRKSLIATMQKSPPRVRAFLNI